MRKFFIFIVLLLSFEAFSQSSTTAQTTNKVETVLVDVNDLSQDQLNKIAEKEQLVKLESKINTYGKWVGVGSEIGVAIRDGLNAIVDVADKFGKTSVGNYTMFLIAYKIIGKDVIRVFIGLMFFIIFTILIFKHYKANFTQYKVKTKSNGWKFWLPNEYQVVKADSNYDGYEFLKWLTVILYIGGCGIIYAIMFG